MKEILFISTLNLATNPRLVKEIDLAIKSNYSVTVVCFEFNNWSKINNDDLISRFKNVEFILIPAGRRPFVPWLFNLLKEKIYRLFGSFAPLATSQISQSVSRRSNLLINAIKKVHHADLVIGHNPGAIYPTLFVAKKFNCPSGFDVEDYHPGEYNNRNLQQITLLLIKKLLPKFNYVSFASELIKNRIEEDFNFKSKNWFSILNYFPSNEFIEPISRLGEKIKFVWFSQNIKKGRGVKEFLELFQMIDNAELHLYGHLDNHFFENELSKYKNIIVHQNITQKQLHLELSLYDIGLALDIANDENRDLAITNKIIAYLQSGLFVLASNISAHKYIINHNQTHGVCFTNSIDDNIHLLKKILSDIETIRQNKIKRYNRFKDYCWEKESVLLINKWEALLY